MTKIALGTWAIAKGMLPIIRATRVRHVVEVQGTKELERVYEKIYANTFDNALRRLLFRRWNAGGDIAD